MEYLTNVRELLEENPESKWGFVIYRCTYGDDAAWDRCTYVQTIKYDFKILTRDKSVAQ